MLHKSATFFFAEVEEDGKSEKILVISHGEDPSKWTVPIWDGFYADWLSQWFQNVVVTSRVRTVPAGDNAVHTARSLAKKMDIAIATFRQ